VTTKSTKPTTKSTKPTTTDPYAEGEAALAAALAKVTEYEQAEVKARKRVREIREEWERGDATATVADKSEAEGDIERFRRLARAAGMDARRLSRALVHRPTVAEKVAPILTDSLGLPVVVVDSVPTEHDSLPAAYLRQAGATEVNKSNPSAPYVAAPLTFYYVRTGFHREVKSDDLARILCAVPGQFTVDGNPVRNRAPLSESDPFPTDGSGSTVTTDTRRVTVTALYGEPEQV
jgi:hypothetical protein